MGSRTLEARLTVRLVALAGVALSAVAIAAVAVTKCTLDRNDTDAAIAHGNDVLSALDRERAEGDSVDEALREVVASAQAQGVRVSIRYADRDAGAEPLADLQPGNCVSVADEHADVWRTCAVGAPASALVTAGVPVRAHHAVIVSLSRGMLAVVIFAFLAMWVAVRRALHAPLNELADVVRWTARLAEVERPVAPPAARTTEVLQLEKAFDAVVQRLLASLARERASSAHIAHELRTPLTAVVAELENLRRAHPFARPATERILGDVARFADVIDAILELSSGEERAPDGPKGGRAAPLIVNLADVVRDLAPPETKVEAPDEALLEVDERLVRLALRNLIDNARKYAGGPVLLKISRSGDIARLTVVDHGPGLDAPARERMFQRYWRGSADSDGRGLGLALVRAVAERAGGRAEAQSGPDGRGLEVSMTFAPLVGWHDETPAASR